MAQQWPGVQAEDARPGCQADVGDRYRVDGRRSARPQVGGLASQGRGGDAGAARRARAAASPRRTARADHAERARCGVPRAARGEPRRSPSCAYITDTTDPTAATRLPGRILRLTTPRPSQADGGTLTVRSADPLFTRAAQSAPTFPVAFQITGIAFDGIPPLHDEPEHR